MCQDGRFTKRKENLRFAAIAALVIAFMRNFREFVRPVRLTGNSARP